MGALRQLANLIVAATCLFLLAVAGPATAQPQHDALDRLFAQLAEPELDDWQTVEDEIWSLWSRSGSPAMDLLLHRGRTAMEAGDLDTAVEHLTALTDHAPDFAEGWNARATAFFHMERLGASISDIRRVLALNPRHFGALSGLGMIMEQLGDDETALAAYRAALSVHPHRPNLVEAAERLERTVSGRDL